MKKAFLLAGMSAAVCSTAALAASDQFNRAVLGPSWVATAGSLFITNNQLQGATGSLGYDKKSKLDTTVTAKVYLGDTSLQYGAVASGNIAGGNNAFVKIQAQNGGGTFDHGGFYVGNNGGGNFFTLNSPVTSPATLTVSFCGTVATMTIKASSGTQVYTYDYGTSFGTGGGLGTYGVISLDNYKSGGGGCAAALEGPATAITGSNATDLSLAR
jgi:hypothetical protein